MDFEHRPGGGVEVLGWFVHLKSLGAPEAQKWLFKKKFACSVGCPGPLVLTSLIGGLLWAGTLQHGAWDSPRRFFKTNPPAPPVVSKLTPWINGASNSASTIVFFWRYGSKWRAGFGGTPLLRRQGAASGRG